MPTTANPEFAYDVGETLLQCALDRVDATWADTEDMAIGRSCVVWGEISWDNCECGQLVVAINDQWPSNEFPRRLGDEVQSRCGSKLWVVQYLVSVLRCVPIPDDDGNPPPCADVQEATRISAIDAWAVRRGIGCCLQDLRTELNEQGRPEITGWQMVGQETSGPAGACAGSLLTVNVGFLNCFCPEESS